MIEEFTRRWFERKDHLRTHFLNIMPRTYKDIVNGVIEMLANRDNEGDVEYGEPNPNNIHQIDDGDYQGTLVFVIPEKAYQPDTYWAVKVSYGSCSACDTLQGILDTLEWYHDGDKAEAHEKAVDEIMMLALHVVQQLKEI
jgi:hypothetical protein